MVEVDLAAMLPFRNINPGSVGIQAAATGPFTQPIHGLRHRQGDVLLDDLDRQWEKLK